MMHRSPLRAGPPGLAFFAALALMALSWASMAFAETLRIQSGAIQRPVKLVMNSAVVVESDTPFAELSIANPSIADFSPLSTTSFYLLGQVPGRTTMTLLNAEGQLITNVEVQVTADVRELKERLREVLPGEPVEVRPANDGIVLSGTVSGADVIDAALDLAERFAPERVSNLMQVGGSQQVMMKVRFAEMSRSVSKALSTSIAINEQLGDRSKVGGTQTYLFGDNLSNLFSGGNVTL